MCTTSRGVDHEHCVVVQKTGCVIDGKMCMSQRKIMKTVITLEKKNMYFVMKTSLIQKMPLPNEH